ncbi:MAG: hypothetical protein MHMPM18_001829 [Marteilia pararefringens]
MRQVESLPTESRKRIEDKHKSIVNQKDRTGNYKAPTTSTKTGDGNFAFCDEYHLGEEARRTTKLTAMRGIIKYNLQRMLNKHCQIELNADNIEMEIINGFILCKYIMSFQKNIIQENQLKMPPYNNPSNIQLPIGDCKANIRLFLNACEKSMKGTELKCTMNDIIGGNLLKVLLLIKSLQMKFAPNNE